MRLRQKFLIEYLRCLLALHKLDRGYIKVYNFVLGINIDLALNKKAFIMRKLT